MKALVLCLAVVLAAIAPALAQDNGGDALAVSETILKEAQRQDNVNQRMATIITQFQQLVADLHDNGIIDDQNERDLGKLVGQLQGLNDEHVARAADYLRVALKDLAAPQPHLKKADREVQVILQELSALLMRAGSSQARLILLSELREIIKKQEAVKAGTTAWGKQLLTDGKAGADAGRELEGNQTQLGVRFGKFSQSLAEMQKNETDAMMQLRLQTVGQMLQDRAVRKHMDDAAADIIASKPIDAVGLQQDILAALREAERMLQPGLEVDDLLKIREILVKTLADQIVLREGIEKTPAPRFAEQKKDLQIAQRSLGKRLEPIDANLFADDPKAATQPAVAAATPATGPAYNPLTGAIGNMTKAEGAIEAAMAAQATSSQKGAESDLKEAIRRLDVRIADLTKSDELARQLADARDRLETIKAMEEKQREFSAATTQAAEQGTKGEQIAKPQGDLGSKVGQMATSMPSTPYTQLMKAPMGEAQKAMGQASKQLSQGNPSAAQPPQQQAQKSLQEAREIAEKEVTNLENKLENARKKEDAREMGKQLEQLAKQEEGLRKEVEKAEGEKKDTSPMAPAQEAIKNAAQQMANQMPQQSPPQTPMAQALEAMQKAQQAMQQNKPKIPSPYMKLAEGMIMKARMAEGELEDQADEEAQVQQQLEEEQIQVLTLLMRQRELRAMTEVARDGGTTSAPASKPASLPATTSAPTTGPAVFTMPELSGEQEVLQAEAQAASENTELIGVEFYAKAATEMKAAAKCLAANEKKNAITHQLAAEAELMKAEEAIAKAAASFQQSDEEIELQPKNGKPHGSKVDLLTKTLILAHKQRELRMVSRQSAENALAKLAPEQAKLKETCDELGPDAEDASSFFDDASKYMDAAGKGLTAQKRTDAVANQLKAEIELRKAVVALAKFLKPPKPKPPKPGSHPGSSNTPKPPSFDYNPESKEGQRMLSASPPGGPEVAKDKSKWQSLGPRERAAVDEKYARELPIEYRQLLEDYFEALSKKGDNSSAGATSAPATPKKP